MSGPRDDGSMTEAKGAVDARWTRRSWWAAAGCLAFLTVVATPSHRGGNTASRLATVESLVHRGTFDISESPFLEETVDYVRLDGRALSTKPPLLPVAAAGVYWALRHGLGLSLTDDLEVTHRVLIFFVETIPHALLLWAAFLLLRLWSDDPRARGWTFVMLCFGFLGAGYATTLNNHSPAAAAVLGGLYFVSKAVRAERPSPRGFMAAGLCVGLAPTLDFLTVPLCVGLFVMLAWRWRGSALAYFALIALLPIALHLYLTYRVGGSVLPIYARGELYRFEGGYWTEPRGMDALDEPKWLYAFHLLFGHHGFFLLSPILGFGLWQAVLQVSRRLSLWRESLVALVGFAAVGGAMVVRTHNYGGACVGFRWLIPVMPWFILLCLPWLEKERSMSRAGLLVAFAVSVVSFVNAAVHPWSHSGVHWLFHQVMDTGALL